MHDHATTTTGGQEQDERTREAILQDLDSIWAGVPKSEDKTYAELSELFDVEIAFLPHPRYRPEEYERYVLCIFFLFLNTFFQKGDGCVV